MTDYPAAADRSGPRADTGVRFVALLIDSVVLVVIQAVAFGVLGEAGQALGALIGFAYYTYFEGSPAGQTIGKRVMKVRVIDFANGQSLGFGKAAIRSVMRFVSGIVCGIGYLWAIWDPQKQTWHDKVAGTVVVPVNAYPVPSWP